jgi:hypothetical protein
MGDYEKKSGILIEKDKTFLKNDDFSFVWGSVF